MKDIIKRMREDYDRRVSLAMFEKSMLASMIGYPNRRSITKKQLRERRERYEASLQEIRNLDQEITEAVSIIKDHNG